MVAAPAATPVIPIDTPIAAELIGSVRIIPISTEIRIPPTTGCCSTLILTRFPNHIINCEIGGPITYPTRAPEQIDTNGVTMISTLVLLDTSLPSSIATRAATNAPNGSPGLPSANAVIELTVGKAPIIPATAADIVTSGDAANLTATPTPIPAPVNVLATLAAPVIYEPTVPPTNVPIWAIIVPIIKVENKPRAIPPKPSINMWFRSFFTFSIIFPPN